MITADTSVLVAAFASWHDAHEVAAEAVGPDLRIVAHAALETYSVLTRLPAPHRIPPAVARRFLQESFSTEWLQPFTETYPALIGTMADAGLAGGSVYDALIGATAVAHDAMLYTLDHRALRVYELFGVSVTVLATKSNKGQT